MAHEGLAVHLFASRQKKTAGLRPPFSFNTDLYDQKSIVTVAKI
jgi:hypothetical protein